MSQPCKETRLRVRCSKCGRVVRSQKSRDMKLCCVCEADENLDKMWARRIKVKDELLVSYMNEKLKPKPLSTLAKLKQVAEQRVEVRGIDELLAFLKKKAI